MDALIEEVLEERCVSSRGQRKPREVKRKMSEFPLRKGGPILRTVHSGSPKSSLFLFNSMSLCGLVFAATALDSVDKTLDTIFQVLLKSTRIVKGEKKNVPISI